MAKILIVEDDVTTAMLLTEAFRGQGHQTESAGTIEACRKKVLNASFDVVFLDVCLPDGNGLTLIAELKKSRANPEVIIMTGHGDLGGAELAIRSGVWDYIQKPSSLKDFTLALNQAVQYREAHSQLQTRETLKREAIVGFSPPLERCLNLVAHAATLDVNVLITGESGTGKELFARAIHENSRRAQGPFIIVDCASLPVNIVEGVLFGHEKGIFTGADQARQGLLLQADGGTLFLDEIGELPMKIQKAFLRVLQEGTFRPLGSKKEVHSDFRLVAATNCNLEDNVRRSLFRGDLLYRMRSVTIDLPPLRERREDINTLVFHYLRKLCDRYHMDIKGFSPEFIEVMNRHDWPGNVRELVHTMESILAVAAADPILYPKHLPVEIRVKLLQESLVPPKSAEAPAGAPAEASPLADILSSRQASDRRYLSSLIAQTGGKVQEMIRVSGLSRAQLYNLMKAHGLNRQSSSSS